MIHTYNPNSDGRHESVELTKRLYRGISDISRQLDERRGRAQTCDDLFLPSVEAQRVKLREYCERLIFTDPVGYGLKAEEILWRKGYYDVVSTAKRLRKNNRWTPLEIAYIQSHLSSGVGHYHHLIFRLQIEFKLDLRGLIDFPLLVSDEGLTKGKSSTSKVFDSSSVSWAEESTHRCLLYLGDLSRYFLDLYPGWDTGLTIRYYLQALNLNSEVGMPHNQLGTLSGSKNFNIDAAYHYMRCLMCPQSFDGAEGNLQRIFEKNNKWLEERSREMESNIDNSPMTPSEHIHCLVARFLLLADIWFFDKTVLHINELCHQIVGDVVQCLQYSIPIPSSVDIRVDVENGQEDTEENPEYLKDEIIFKIVVMSLLCAGKLKSNSSKQHSIAIAFILGILSKFVHQAVHHIQSSVFHRSLNTITYTNGDPDHSTATMSSSCATEVVASKVDTDILYQNPLTTLVETNGIIDKSGKEKKAKKRKKLRRRRRRRITDSSDESDENADDSDDSDVEEHLAYSTDDEEFDDDSDDGIPIIQMSSNEKSTTIVKDIQYSTADEVKEKTLGTSISNGISNGKDIPNEETPYENNVALPLPQARPTLNPADLIELITGDRIFDIVKILFDWLRGDAAVIEDCSINSRDLLTEIIVLLNLIKIDPDVLISESESAGAKIFQLKDIDKVFHKIPLPEDIVLRGVCLPSLKNVHDVIDWEYLRHRCFHSKEEALIRVYKMVDFGNFLVSNNDLGVTLDSEQHLFAVSSELPKKSLETKCKSVESENRPKAAWKRGNKSQPISTESQSSKDDSGPQKGALMKNMHALWLRGEVKALESNSKKRGKVPVFSPYLAVDVDALIHHTQLVKQLVEARTFIVLIPTVVMGALDDLKSEVPRAREINRWLGLQHEKVNRFVRVQGPSERLPIPLIKYPKKKDKEAWLFFQVVECCQYFNAKYGSNPNVPLVTLLSGQKNCSVMGANDEVVKGLSPMGIAKSAGINLEYIETFHSKWKTSSKNHG